MSVLLVLTNDEALIVQDALSDLKAAHLTDANAFAPGSPVYQRAIDKATSAAQVLRQLQLARARDDEDSGLRYAA
jgi:hypothetical protein